MLTHVRIEGVKGRTAGIDITGPHLLLLGPMGSGKSAVLDGIALALNLPTVHGSRQLDRLSPTGRWAVTLCFDHPSIRRLTREVQKSKGVFEVNGRRVSATEYEEAVHEVCNLEPHHVSMHEFLGLSGQKRAAMFARVLESGGSKTLGEVLESQGETVDHLLGVALDGDLGSVSTLIDELQQISGNAEEITEAVRQQTGLARQREQDAKIRLEGIIEKAGAVSHGMSLHEIQSKLSEADGALGSLRDRRQTIEADRARYDAAQQVVRSAQRAVDAQQAIVAGLVAKADELTAAHEEYATLAKALERHRNARKAANDDLYECQAKLDAATSAVMSAQHRGAMAADIDALEWDIDFTPLALECGLGEATLNKALVEFAKRAVALVLGGNAESLHQELADAESSRSAAQATRRAAEGALTEIGEALAETERRLDKQSTRIADLQIAVDGLPAARARLEELDRERANVTQTASQTAVPEDEEVLNAQIEQAQADRNAVAAQQRELQDSQSVTGQLEQCRVDVVVAQAVHQGMKAVSEAVQRWRDAEVTGRLASVLAPFEDRFTMLFGDRAQIAHHAAGSGRSTEFYFTLTRRGTSVPLDLLSDGESVLAAAAFLSALQTVSGDLRGTMLLLNDLGLDDHGCQLFVKGGPKLGLGFVALATSRLAPSCYQGWQVVDMSNPPNSRR